MAALLEHIDPEGLEEFSVVFTDRSLNHMSTSFQSVMTDISGMLKEVYNADATALIPGGGTYGMEAVARQFGRDAKVLVVRNGWFSYRWSQIFETSSIAADVEVMKARRTGNGAKEPFRPAAIEDVVARIHELRPDVVFAPHVETSAGVILPDDYVTALASAARDVGAIMVLDCIASGCVWVDMKATGVDVLISAPQKGWSASPSAGLVMMSERAVQRLDSTDSDSFAIDLKKWYSIMQTYENGGHAYHATMPTDALRAFRDTMLETKEYGFDKLCDAQWELGNRVRDILKAKGIQSVAADERAIQLAAHVHIKRRQVKIRSVGGGLEGVAGDRHVVGVAKREVERTAPPSHKNAVASHRHQMRPHGDFKRLNLASILA